MPWLHLIEAKPLTVDHQCNPPTYTNYRTSQSGSVWQCWCGETWLLKSHAFSIFPHWKPISHKKAEKILGYPIPLKPQEEEKEKPTKFKGMNFSIQSVQSEKHYG